MFTVMREWHTNLVTRVRDESVQNSVVVRAAQYGFSLKLPLATIDPQGLCPCRRFTPSVIEPSFGIGRILYCMFEHAYYMREGSEEKAVFRSGLLKLTPHLQR